MPLPSILQTAKDSLLAAIGNQQVTLPNPDITSDGLTWILENVFHADNNTITVSSASVTETDQPSVQLACTFQLFGEVNFDLTFTFTVDGSNAIITSLEAIYPSVIIAAGALKLEDILSKLNINIPVIPNLVIGALKVSASKDFFGVESLTFNNTWTLSLGANNLEVSGLALSLGYTQGEGFSGSLRGTVTIDTASFDIQYIMPGDFEVSGIIPSIDFRDLVNSFISSTPFTYSSGFPNLILNNAACTISKKDTNYELNVDVNDINGWGEFETDIQYVNHQWEFAAGFALHPDWKLSSISSVFNPIKDITFANTGLIISSYADNDFAFKNGDVSKPENGIVAGINVFGTLQFPADTSSAVGALGKLIGKQGATLEMLAQIPFSGVNDTKFTVSLGGALYIPSAASASSFNLSNPSLFITPQPSFGVSGTLNIPVKGQTFPIDGELLVSTTEIGFNAYANTSNLTNPVGFNGVRLEGVGVSLDLEIETLNCALALEGVFALVSRTGTTARASKDQVAFKFAVGAEDAYPIYLIASFDQLDLPSIYNAVMNPGNQLPSELGNISFQKLLIYWADQNNTLPDGTLISAGFQFNAQPATFFGFQANAAVQMDFSHGFSGSFNVVTPILIKNGDVLTITQAGDAGKGPQLAFSTTNSPYLQASVDATLFRMASTSISASISSRSMNLMITNHINNFLDSNINLTVSADSPNYYFAFLSNVNVLLNIDVAIPPVGNLNLGTLHIHNTGFKGSLNCHLDSSGFNLTMQGGIIWEGKSWTMPSLVINVLPSDLSSIPSAIRNQWQDKGKDIFTGIGSDMHQYLNFIKDGVLTGGDSVSKVLMGIFSVRPDQIPGILKNYGIKESTTLHVSYTGHLDTSQHINFPAVHGDVAGVHMDTRPHWDTRLAHVDHHTGIGHWDTGGQHTDSSSHTDTNITPHGDGIATPHGDTNPHVDSQSTHIDESIHIDV